MSSFASLKEKRRSRQQPSHFVDVHRNTSNREVAAVEEPNAALNPPALKPRTVSYKYEGGLYSEFPPTLEIRVSEKSGRGLWVREGLTIKAGTTLVRVQPHAAALSSVQLVSYCTGCFLSPASSLAPSSQVGELKRCTGCGVVRYCSTTCQGQDWPAHKQECKVLKSLAGKPPPGEAVRALGRLVWGRQRHGKDSNWWKEVDLMQSEVDLLPATHHEPLAMLGLSLSRYLGVDPSQSPPEETSRILSSHGFDSGRHLVNFLGRFGTNSFSLTSPDLSNIGVCISPLAALISHSCEPNAVVVFPWGGGHRGALEVVAIRDLEPGEEILTSYIDVTLPKDKRQADLKDRYQFTCDCSLCTKEDNPGYVDPRRSLRCRTAGCKGKLSMPDSETNSSITCGTCARSFEVSLPDVLHAIQLGEQALEKADAIQYDEPDRAFGLVASVLPHLTRHLSISSYPLLSLFHLYQTLLISKFSSLTRPDPTRDQLVDYACQCGALALSGMSDVHPAGHPARGIEYTSLAKLLLVEVDPVAVGGGARTSGIPPEVRLTLPTGLARLHMAMDLLGKATEELHRGFGKEGGLVGRDVRLLMEGLERELKMWSSKGVRLNVLGS